MQVLYEGANLLACSFRRDQIPEALLSALTGLQRLSACGNALTSLPESVGRLMCLEALLLDNNKLMSLPDALGARMTLGNGSGVQKSQRTG